MEIKAIHLCYHKMHHTMLRVISGQNAKDVFLEANDIAFCS